MAQIIDMPRLSDTMKEGVLVKWHKNEGDSVSPGDVLAEVETDKATMDFEAFDEGVLLKRLVADGQAIPVGGPVAILGAAGEDISALLKEAEGRAGSAAKTAAGQPQPVRADVAHPEQPAVIPVLQPPTAPAQTRPPSAGTEQLPHPASPAVPTQPPAAAPAAPAPDTGARVIASPLARRLAEQLGVALGAIRGSGPGGRIVERDVKAAASAAPPAPAAPAARPAAAAAPAPAPAPRLPEQLLPERRQQPRPAAPLPEGDVEKPLSMMRRTIARRLTESKQNVPHFYLTAEADMDAAMSFREQIRMVHEAKLSVNDMIIKAVALALRRVPEANASFTEEAIVQHGRVDIGMAVAIEDGLVTPVIRDADRKTLGQISNEARELAERARARKLHPDEMTGSTFSISNLGMFGIRQFEAVINPPEGAILAVGAVRKEPVVRGDAIVIGQRMSLTLSCDHRVVDGAVGAKLLQALIAILERPISLAF